MNSLKSINFIDPTVLNKLLFIHNQSENENNDQEGKRIR